MPRTEAGKTNAAYAKRKGLQDKYHSRVKENGPVFDKNYKSPATKNGAIPAMRRVESLCNELLSIDEKPKNAELTIKWKHLGHNNYEIYVMWS